MVVYSQLIFLFNKIRYNLSCHIQYYEYHEYNVGHINTTGCISNQICLFVSFTPLDLGMHFFFFMKDGMHVL